MRFKLLAYKFNRDIEKNWKIIFIILIVLRFLLSFNLPSFYLNNLKYDDRLMLSHSTYLLEGKYLGNYCDLTLIKGIVFPFFLFAMRYMNIGYSLGLTVLYVLSCIFIVYSMNKFVDSKKALLFIFIFLLFNPITYASDTFQRLYRNSLSYIELLFFLGIIISIVCTKKENIFKYIFLGLTTAIMLLTREDTIWTIVILALVVILKLYKSFNLKKMVLLCIIPFITVALVLNIISFINYKYYGIYTYDETRSSSFKVAYNMIKSIKDDKKIDKVSISRNMLYDLAEHSSIFGFTKKQIDNRYSMVLEDEICNGNVMWYLRNWIYQKEQFKDGKEADNYYSDLKSDITELFESRILEKSFVVPLIHINIPTLNEIKQLPKDLVKAILYTTTYNNVKTFGKEKIEKDFEYNENVKAYYITYNDYHNAENIIETNVKGVEIIRNIYKYFTIIFSIVALVIYFKNITKKDNLNYILHVILLIYLMILGGVTYTHTTAFDAIRYCYLANVYLLQNLFILLNLYRFIEQYKEEHTIKLLNSGENAI